MYFLFGEKNDEAKPLAYIGEAENCFDRLIQHNKQKEFWNTAIVITSKTSSFTKAHGKYLEWYCLAITKEVGRYTLSQIMPSKPYVSEPMEADLLDNFDAIKILLSTLGHPILEEIPQPTLSRNLVYCKRKGAFAEGEYTNEGFIVFKGSRARTSVSDTTKGEWILNLREQLRQSNVLVIEGEHLVFTSDYIFNSPSTAATIVIGSPANGWVEWKDKNSKTLDELKRQ